MLTYSLRIGQYSLAITTILISLDIHLNSNIIMFLTLIIILAILTINTIFTPLSSLHSQSFLISGSKIQQALCNMLIKLYYFYILYTFSYVVFAGNYWSQFGQIDTVPIWDIAVFVNNDDYFSLFPMFSRCV